MVVVARHFSANFSPPFIREALRGFCLDLSTVRMSLTDLFKYFAPAQCRRTQWSLIGLRVSGLKTGGDKLHSLAGLVEFVQMLAAVNSLTALDVTDDFHLLDVTELSNLTGLKKLDLSFCNKLEDISGLEFESAQMA